MKIQKKVMMLGGLRYMLPVIKAAHELGYYVITCDYLPDNIAHAYSDEYHNVSILDKEAVLDLARKLEIDGIMSFAVDPGVATAFYVSEQMGLPGSPYESVKILQNKALFRQFLQDNGFEVPRSKGYTSVEDALRDESCFTWPVIVKPVDSAGSKGVAKVDVIDHLREAAQNAQKHSFSGEFIIEDFIEKEGCSSDSDGFSVNGELKFVSFSDQYFDASAANPYTPSAFCWPSRMSAHHQKELKGELQRLLTLLKMGTGIYNIETRVGKDGRAYIMEVSPRGGGNRISEILRYATGVDLIKNAVRAAVGDEIVDLEMPQYKGYWGEVILHADRGGVFRDIKIDKNLSDNVKELDLWIEPGDPVTAFNGANDTIGTLILRFDDEGELHSSVNSIKTWMNLVVD